MEARLEQEVDGLRGAIGGCQLDSSSEPVQISRGLIDVQEGLTERGVFLVSELHVAELHDVAASDPHGLRGHSLGNIDHRGDRPASMLLLYRGLGAVPLRRTTMFTC